MRLWASMVMDSEWPEKRSRFGSAEGPVVLGKQVRRGGGKIKQLTGM